MPEVLLKLYITEVSSEFVLLDNEANRQFMEKEGHVIGSTLVFPTLDEYKKFIEHYQEVTGLSMAVSLDQR